MKLTIRPLLEVGDYPVDIVAIQKALEELPSCGWTERIFKTSEEALSFRDKHRPRPTNGGQEYREQWDVLLGSNSD